MKTDNNIKHIKYITRVIERKGNYRVECDEGELEKMIPPVRPESKEKSNVSEKQRKIMEIVRKSKIYS